MIRAFKKIKSPTIFIFFYKRGDSFKVDILAGLIMNFTKASFEEAHWHRAVRTIV